jgi:hypothetical protein
VYWDFPKNCYSSMQLLQLQKARLKLQLNQHETDMNLLMDAGHERLPLPEKR